MPGFAEEQAAFAAAPAPTGAEAALDRGNPNAPAKPRDGRRRAEVPVIDGK